MAIVLKDLFSTKTKNATVMHGGVSIILMVCFISAGTGASAKIKEIIYFNTKPAGLF